MKQQNGGAATLEKHDIAKLERTVKDLGTALGRLSSKAEIDELIIILHRPGWTTPAEFAFASAIAESMLAHVGVVAQLKEQFVHAARAVRPE